MTDKSSSRCKSSTHTAFGSDEPTMTDKSSSRCKSSTHTAFGSDELTMKDKTSSGCKSSTHTAFGSDEPTKDDKTSSGSKSSTHTPFGHDASTRGLLSFRPLARCFPSKLENNIRRRYGVTIEETDEKDNEISLYEDGLPPCKKRKATDGQPKNAASLCVPKSKNFTKSVYGLSKDSSDMSAVSSGRYGSSLSHESDTTQTSVVAAGVRQIILYDETGRMVKTESRNRQKNDDRSCMTFVKNQEERLVNIKKTGSYEEDRDKCREFHSTKSLSHRYKKVFDDTLTESVVENLAKNMKSVGILVSHGHPIGTVFCAGKKYVITAFHVIQSIPEKSLFDGTATFLNFKESPLTPTEEVFTFKSIVFKNQQLDIAVLEVSNPERLPKGITLSKSNQDGVSHVSVIGYGHPSHPKKTLDPSCTLVKPNSSRIAQAQKYLNDKMSYHKSALRILGRPSDTADKGLGFLNEYYLIMDSFMEKGTSGAPALAAGIDGSVEVIGIVTHGTPELYYLLPQLIKQVFPCEHRFAVGAKMKAVYDRIHNKDLKLANALFSEG